MPEKMYIQNAVIRLNDESLFQFIKFKNYSVDMLFSDIIDSNSNNQYVIPFFLLVIASVFCITLFQLRATCTWKNSIPIKNKNKKSTKEKEKHLNSKDVIYDAQHDIFFENPRTWGLYSKYYSEC